MAEVVYRVGGLYIEHRQESLMLTLTTEARILRATFMYDEILRLTSALLSVSKDYLEYLMKNAINALEHQEKELEKMKKEGRSVENQEKAIRERKEHIDELYRTQIFLSQAEESITKLLKTKGS